MIAGYTDFNTVKTLEEASNSNEWFSYPLTDNEKQRLYSLQFGIDKNFSTSLLRYNTLLWEIPNIVPSRRTWEWCTHPNAIGFTEHQLRLVNASSLTHRISQVFYLNSLRIIFLLRNNDTDELYSAQWVFHLNETPVLFLRTKDAVLPLEHDELSVEEILAGTNSLYRLIDNSPDLEDTSRGGVCRSVTHFFSTFFG